MYVENRIERRKTRLPSLTKLWSEILARMTFEERYTSGSDTMHSMDAGHQLVDDLDPSAKSHSLLMWMRLLTGWDDELYALAVLDLLDQLDLASFHQVSSWERRHFITLVTAEIQALHSTAVGDLERLKAPERNSQGSSRGMTEPDTKKLGPKIDKLYALEQKVKAINAAAQLKLDPLKKEMDALETEILNEFSADEIAGAFGKVATAERKRSPVPSLKDWNAFTAYVAKTKSFDLLERRVSKTAWNERTEAGVKVPGVETFIRIWLSIRKKTTK